MNRNPISARFDDQQPGLRPTVVLAALVLALAVCSIARAATEGQAPAPPSSVLGAFGIGPKYFEQMKDRLPLRENESAIVLYILFRLRHSAAGRLLEDASPAEVPQIDVAKINEDPAAARGRLLAAGGRVEQFEEVASPPAEAQRYGLSKYYRCVVAQQGSGRRVAILTDRVPLAWLRKSPVGSTAAAVGFFAKLSGADRDQPLPLLVSPRVAWHPNTPFGQLGVDAAVFEGVTDGATWTPADGEAFYRILTAAGSRVASETAGTSELTAEDLATMLQDPAGNRGRLVQLSGTVGNVTRVGITDGEVTARFAVDHYYQIEVFPSQTPDDPVIVCVPRLPEGMKEGRAADDRLVIRVAGFFLRRTSYPVPPAANDGPMEPGKQVLLSAPLLVAGPPEVVAKLRPTTTGTANLAAAVVLALVIIGVGLLLWQLRRSDRELRRLVESSRRK